MSIPTHIFVTAAEGREVPVPLSEGSAPGSTLLRCKPGKVYRLQNTSYTRRRILAGDLMPTTIGGVKVAELEQAAAGDLGKAHELGPDGDVIPKAAEPPPPAPEPVAEPAPAKTSNPRKG